MATTRKVLATGDNHFDRSSRFEECVHVHDAIVEIARAERVDLALLAGDMYERASTPEERAAVARFAMALADVCPVVIVRGNHDQQRDCEILANLAARHPIIVEERAGVHLVGGFAVAAMAWPERANLAAMTAATSGEALEQDAQQALQNILRGLGAMLDQHAAMPKVGVGHWLVDGSVTSVGQPLIGHAMNVGLTDLAMLNAPLVVAAHIHKAQEWKQGATDIVYTGSPYRTKHGEVEEKSVVVAEYSGAELVSWRRVPTPCAGMFLLEDEWGADDDGVPGWLAGWDGVPLQAELQGSDVRLRYRVSADQRVAARESADRFAAGLLSRGARAVKVDPEVRPASVARAPEVARATTLAAKLDAMWTLRGTVPDAARIARLMSRLKDLEDAVPAEARHCGGGVKFLGMRVHGMSVYENVDIDFTKLPGTLTALVAPNGEGKSVLLGMLGGSIDREVRTQSAKTALHKLATGRNSMLETRLQNGTGPYTVRHLIDGVSGTAEALVLLEDGTPAYESTKVSVFDAWAKKRLPPVEHLYNTQIAVQSKPGFLGLGGADCKDLVLEMMGLARIETVAELGRGKVKSSRAIFDQLVLQLAEMPAPNMEGLSARVALEGRAVEAAAEGVAAARTALERAKAAAADAARLAELVEQRRAAEKRLAAAQEQLADLQERIANNRRLIAQGEEIRAAQARAAEVDTAVSAHEPVLNAAEKRAATTDNAAVAADLAAQSVQREINAADTQITRIEARLRDRAAVEGASARIDEINDKTREMNEQEARAEARVTDLEQLVLNGKDQRIAGLRAGLAHIAEEAHTEDGADMAGPWAANVLAADDQLAAAASSAPEDLSQARGDVTYCRAQLRTLAEEYRKAQALAARKGDIDQALRDKAQADQERAALVEKLAVANAAAVAAHAEKKASATAEATAKERMRSLKQERQDLAPKLALAPRLETAHARVEELEAQLPKVEGGVAAARGELATLPEVEVGQAVDLVVFERSLTQAEHGERVERERETAAKLAIVAAEETRAKREALVEKRAAAEQELGDWTRLAQDLGRDGIQALEIDAAVPEINATTQELLSGCYGNRYSAELVTTKLLANGTQREGLVLRVTDNERGREAPASDFSGGQRAIIGEAVALSLTALNCRRNGTEDITLIRDESGAQLDLENGRAYVGMMRLAGQKIGASRILWVTHTPELAELADSRLIIAGGTVRAA